MSCARSSLTSAMKGLFRQTRRKLGEKLHIRSRQNIRQRAIRATERRNPHGKKCMQIILPVRSSARFRRKNGCADTAMQRWPCWHTARLFPQPLPISCSTRPLWAPLLQVGSRNLSAWVEAFP